MMLVLSWQLTLIVIVMLVIMFAIIKSLGGKSVRGFAAQQKALGVVDGYIEEMISGQKVVKVFNHEPEVAELRSSAKSCESHRQRRTPTRIS